MKRLATLVLAAGFAVSSLVAMGQGASATPFSDVPANHWAYQAIQSLAADGLVEGYPDGKFKGDRPLTRYEMAVLVARVIAKLQANGAQFASKADLDKLQKLIDALKDELDSLGVRVTNLEDALDALDKRTKFAQSIQLHGTIAANNSARQRYAPPLNVQRTAGADAYVSAYLTAPANNSPLEQQGPGLIVRYDDKFVFSYAINENLTVSIPLHILSYQFGGEFGQTHGISIQPDVVVNVAKAGALSNLRFRSGQLDDLRSSRLSLAYRAPDASQQGPGQENPVQPYEKGFSFGAVLNGLTDFQISFTRLDQQYLNTLNSVGEPFYSPEVGINNYFFYRTPPQSGYFQNGAPNAAAGGSFQTFTFTAQGPTQQVYLPSKAVSGTVTVVSVNGVACTAVTSGGIYGPYSATCPIAAGGFYYVDTNNQVVFRTPVASGSTVVLGFVQSAYNNNLQQVRYHINGRLNQKIKGLPGAEIGLSFSRVFDFADVIDAPNGRNAFSAPAGAPSGTGYGYVSDTVFGLDFQLPLSSITLGRDKTQHPVLFAEGAFSRYTPDFYNTPALTDSALVAGLRLKVYSVTASLQYQAVGRNFLSGAPIRYYGPPPTEFGYWSGSYLPGFYGFGNNFAINKTLDGAAQPACAGTACLANSASFTQIYPVFNPFVATGPQFFSAFAPNSQGWTLNLGSPIRIGDTTVTGTLVAQHLEELTTNGFGQLNFNGVPGSNTKLKFDKLQGGAAFSIPVFGTKIALNLSGVLDHLARNDKTAYVYNPLSVAGSPATQAGVGAAVPAGVAAYQAGAAPVLYYPNYIDDYHTQYAVAATLPVTRDVVFGVGYDTQAYHGSYGNTVGQNIAQRKDQYQATVTYNIPKTTSSISALFRNNKYVDNVLPTFNFNQNREDVTFSIRF